MASSNIVDLTSAIAELEELNKLAKHPINQKMLAEELRVQQAKLSEMIRREQLVSQKSDPPASAVRPLKKLANYAFDESDKFVKLYYTVPADISNLSADSIQAKFTDSSFDVRCTNHDGVDYEVRVQGLLHPVEPSKCQVKPKGRDMLLVMLKKAKEGQTWGSLLKMDSKKAEKMPNMEEDADDPQAGLMKMMKKMYDEGDDEMKRTIRKSFHESQNKQGGGGEAGMGGMGGMMGGMGGMAGMMGGMGAAGMMPGMEGMMGGMPGMPDMASMMGMGGMGADMGGLDD